MILPRERDPRLVTIRRGGSLTDADHHLIALWAADCAEHVLPLFERVVRDDERPRAAIAAVRQWTGGELPMMRTRAAGGHAMGAARPLRGPARFAAYSAGQAAVVAHVPEHDLGAAAYAIRAAMAVAAEDADEARRTECAWQHARMPIHLRELILSDQRRRNPICWNVFIP